MTSENKWRLCAFPKGASSSAFLLELDLDLPGTGLFKPFCDGRR